MSTHDPASRVPAQLDGIEDLLAEARTWLEDDPDPTTAHELRSVIDAAESGEARALADLRDRFAGLLEFGTAGLRGALGAGPNRMNRAVVIRAAAGLLAYLKDEYGAGQSPLVVIGYDARYNSDVFARDTAAVFVAGGARAVIMPAALPTPLLAFAVRHLSADAGVMVTASHNPPQDNGYKVYLGDGSQIVPPADAQIAAHIARTHTVAQVARADEGWQTLDHGIVEAYLSRAVSVLDPHSPRDLSVVHTSLHGVGHATVSEAFGRAGFTVPQPVPDQADPDPDFPTVAFPNPEEAGAIDRALELARRTGADLVLANDPDADRCAAAVDDPAAGGWRMLRGDEVGALLGQHWATRHAAAGASADGASADATFACSIVSSRLLGAIATAHGLRHEQTLTGFKWISRVEGLVYGYEEALGYCVDPQGVRDKDGVTAALMLAELAATRKAAGQSLLDVLDDLARDHGVYATDSFSIRVADLVLIPQIMGALRAAPPAQLAGVAVERLDDLATGVDGLPPTDGLRFLLADRSRVIVRPSGTEPKVKVYLEVIEPVQAPLATTDPAADAALRSARAEAATRLALLRADLEALTAVPQAPDPADTH